MDARTAVETLRRRVRDTLRPLLDGARRVAIIGFPNYANVGDSAIYLGQLACLASLGVSRTLVIADFRTSDRGEILRHLGSSGAILLAGGGNFGDLWPHAQEMREEVIRDFPTTSIIQLPQTIHFEREDSLHRARAALSAHRNLTVLARDDRSLSIASREFGVRTLLCPDMAFALGPLRRPGPSTRPVVWLLRSDKETRGGRPPAEARAIDWLDEPPTVLGELSSRLIRASRRRGIRWIAHRLLGPIYAPLARQRLGRGIETLASGDVVVTDRLHGHILCLLLGIPHVLLDNGYGKVSSFHETWTAGIESVRSAESLDEAALLAAELTRTLPHAAAAASRRG